MSKNHLRDWPSRRTFCGIYTRELTETSVGQPFTCSNCHRILNQLFRKNMIAYVSIISSDETVFLVTNEAGLKRLEESEDG